MPVTAATGVAAGRAAREKKTRRTVRPYYRGAHSRRERDSCASANSAELTHRPDVSRARAHAGRGIWERKGGVERSPRRAAAAARRARDGGGADTTNAPADLGGGELVERELRALEGREPAHVAAGEWNLSPLWTRGAGRISVGRGAE